MRPQENFARIRKRGEERGTNRKNDGARRIDRRASSWLATAVAEALVSVGEGGEIRAPLAAPRIYIWRALYISNPEPDQEGN